MFFQYKSKNWISIYEVIHDDYVKVVKLFPIKSVNQCKNNSNSPHNILNEVREAFKNMALGNWLYAQAVMVHRRELDDKK